MSPETKLWIEAAKILGKNPEAEVYCPECKNGVLKVKDVPFDDEKIDRYLFCDSCSKWNVLTMLKPE